MGKPRTIDATTETKVQAMITALREATAASPIVSAVLMRDGKQIGSIAFSGDDYIVETPKQTTYPVHLRVVAERLVREDFAPSEIVGLTEELAAKLTADDEAQREAHTAKVKKHVEASGITLVEASAVLDAIVKTGRCPICEHHIGLKKTHCHCDCHDPTEPYIDAHVAYGYVTKAAE